MLMNLLAILQGYQHISKLIYLR